MKSLVLTPSRRSDCLMLQNVYISLPYIMAARIAGIDKIEESASLSIYVSCVSKIKKDTKA